MQLLFNPDCGAVTAVEHVLSEKRVNVKADACVAISAIVMTTTAAVDMMRDDENNDATNWRTV